MSWFKNFYSWLERGIFNTLTRKLVGNVLTLVGLQFVTALLGWMLLESLDELVQTNPGNDALASQLQTIASQGQSAFLVLALLSLVCSVLTLLFLRYLVVRPIRQMN
jgi:methyl-accepting chemotaxis protein